MLKNTPLGIFSGLRIEAFQKHASGSSPALGLFFGLGQTCFENMPLETPWGHFLTWELKMLKNMLLSEAR